MFVNYFVFKVVNNMGEYFEKLYREIRRNMIKIYSIEIVLLIISVLGLCFLIPALNKNDLDIIQYVLSILCINVIIDTLIGFIQRKTESVILSVFISIMMFIISTVVFIMMGYTLPSGGKTFVAVIISILLQCVVGVLFVSLYLSTSCCAKVTNIANTILHACKEFNELIDDYNSHVSGYNAIVYSVIDMTQKLGLKRSRIKLLDEYPNNYDPPRFDTRYIDLVHPIDFQTQTEKYSSNSVSYINKIDKKTNELSTQIEYIEKELNKKGELYIEVSRIMDNVNDKDLPDNVRKMFADAAKTSVGTLNKKNRKIKKVR